MRTLVARFFLFFLGVIIAISVAEFVLRAFFPEKTMTRILGPYTFPCYEKGTYAYVRLKRNEDCTLISNYSAFPDITVKTNALGLRNRELTPKKPIGTKRILFLGDSFTMGVGVTENQTYARIAEKLLNKSSKNGEVEAINAGVNATGPYYQFTYLKHEGLLLDPDVVVIGFFPWNDISYDVHASEKVTSVDKQNFPDTIDSRTAYVDFDGSLREKRLPLRVKIPFLRSLHIYWVAINAISPSDKNHLRAEDGTLPCLYDSTCKTLGKAKNDIKKLFLSYKALAKQHNFRLLVLIIPAEFEVDPFTFRKYGFQKPLFKSKASLPHEEFAAFFEKNQIAYLDLLPTFLKQVSEQAYFEKDPHWNAYGNLVAAEAISQKLHDSPVPDEKNTSTQAAGRQASETEE